MLIVPVMDVSLTRLLSEPGIINCHRYGDDRGNKRTRKMINAPFSYKSQVFTKECVYTYGLGIQLCHFIKD